MTNVSREALEKATDLIDTVGSLGIDSPELIELESGGARLLWHLPQEFGVEIEANGRARALEGFSGPLADIDL